TGRMNSMPARSAIRHMAAMSSQLAGHRSGARLMVRPPSQLALNTPSLKALEPRMGLVGRVSVIPGSLAIRPASHSLASPACARQDSPESGRVPRMPLDERAGKPESSYFDRACGLIDGDDHESASAGDARRDRSARPDARAGGGVGRLLPL